MNELISLLVDQYLEETKDSGIVGMVRQEKDENYIYLDAAVRYAVNSVLTKTKEQFF